MHVSIIGFGRFGRMLGSLLVEWHGKMLQLSAASRSNHAEAVRRAGLAWVSMEAAAQADVVILCVPIRELSGVIDAIAPLVRPGSLVMDTCSVKTYPGKVMERGLPQSVDLLGSHPMFGPDSVRDFGIAGQRLVLCPVRVEEARVSTIQGWFQVMGVEILRMTPEEHDRQAAISQGLVHFIGRVVERAGFHEPAVTTHNAHRLFELTRSVVNDSKTLFYDLENLNPFAGAARAAFLDAAKEIETDLIQGNGGSQDVPGGGSPSKAS